MLPRASDVPFAALLSLDGRGAVVTGGAKGIGRAICARLCQAGALVLMSDRDAPALERAATELACDGVVADLTDPAAVIDLVSEAKQRLGRLDIWVNNVGAYPPVPFVDVDDVAWRSMVDANLTSAFLGSRAAARVMIERGTGVIVNIASDAGLQAMPGLSHYAAAKHGVVGLTKGIALELAPHGVRALAVAPGLVVTEGTLNYDLVRDVARRSAAEAQIAAGRFAEPDDVARVVLFAASDAAAYMSGSVLLVDGGLVAGGSPPTSARIR
jgi:NAD(P)-dependent dehydrogenase (short-subunit alcohol dehydrogenase family)